jgi:hypothetical protein
MQRPPLVEKQEPLTGVQVAKHSLDSRTGANSPMDGRAHLSHLSDSESLRTSFIYPFPLTLNALTSPGTFSHNPASLDSVESPAACCSCSLFLLFSPCRVSSRGSFSLPVLLSSLNAFFQNSPPRNGLLCPPRLYPFFHHVSPLAIAPETTRKRSSSPRDRRWRHPSSLRGLSFAHGRRRESR